MRLPRPVTVWESHFVGAIFPVKFFCGGRGESLFPTDLSRRRVASRTWDASVDDAKELLVAARVAEERRVDGHRAARLAGAGAVQREVDVDVAVARVRHVALGGHQRMVAAVARPVEHDQLRRRTDDLEDRVEADELVETAVRRPRQRPHCAASCVRSHGAKSAIYNCVGRSHSELTPYIPLGSLIGYQVKAGMSPLPGGR